MCICKNSEVITTSGNLAAILDFWHPSTFREMRNATTRKLDPENIVVADGILMICVMYHAGFRACTHRRPTKPEVPTLESLTPMEFCRYVL